jgi:hypothetical protein
MSIKQMENYDIEERLVELARAIYGEIELPLGASKRFLSAFTYDEMWGFCFWFNSSDQSTHLVNEKTLSYCEIL